MGLIDAVIKEIYQPLAHRIDPARDIDGSLQRSFDEGKAMLEEARDTDHLEPAAAIISTLQVEQNCEPFVVLYMPWLRAHYADKFQFFTGRNILWKVSITAVPRTGNHALLGKNQGRSAIADLAFNKRTGKIYAVYAQI